MGISYDLVLTIWFTEVLLENQNLNNQGQTWGRKLCHWKFEENKFGKQSQKKNSGNGSAIKISQHNWWSSFWSKTFTKLYQRPLHKIVLFLNKLGLVFGTIFFKIMSVLSSCIHIIETFGKPIGNKEYNTLWSHVCSIFWAIYVGWTIIQHRSPPDIEQHMCQDTIP